MSETMTFDELKALCEEIDSALLKFKQSMSELADEMNKLVKATEIAANMEDFWKHQRSGAE